MKKGLLDIRLLIIICMHIQSLFGFSECEVSSLHSSQQEAITSSISEFKASKSCNEMSIHYLSNLICQEMMIVEQLMCCDNRDMLRAMVDERERMLCYAPACVADMYDNIMNTATYGAHVYACSCSTSCCDRPKRLVLSHENKKLYLAHVQCVLDETCDLLENIEEQMNAQLHKKLALISVAKVVKCLYAQGLALAVQSCTIERKIARSTTLLSGIKLLCNTENDVISTE